MGNNVQIVNTKEPYTYERLQEDLKKLKDKYSFLQIETIGESIQKRAIQSVRIGTGQNEVMYSSSIHANEYITTNVLMKFIEDFCDAYVRDDDIFDWNVQCSRPNLYILQLFIFYLADSHSCHGACLPYHIIESNACHNMLPHFSVES